MDFGTKYGKAMLGMLTVIAELEKDIIRETLLENRVAHGKRGIPTSGEIPYGRKWNKKTSTWEPDEDIVKLMEWSVEEYLKGVLMYKIAETLHTQYNQPMSYVNLLKTLSKRCGDQWTVNFKEEEPITYQVPRILSEDTIQRIRDRVDFNRTSNRTDVINKYVLSGFIHCEQCGNLLTGKSQHPDQGNYRYYSHRKDFYDKCKTFSSIPSKQIECAVFDTIFENIVDVPSFERVIAENMPDKKMISDLEMKIKTDGKELKRITKELDKLVELALSVTLSIDTIKGKELELVQAKTKLEDVIQTSTNQLRSLPDVGAMKQEVDNVRRQLLEQFSGTEHLQAMTFEEKRKLLHWLFDGKDQKGTRYGIYVNKIDRGKKQKIDYFMYGKIIRLRTIKGDNINYQEDEQIYGTNKVTLI